MGQLFFPLQSPARRNGHFHLTLRTIKILLSCALFCFSFSPPRALNSALVLGPVGRDLLPDPLVVGVVAVARPHDGPGALGLQRQAVAARPVVHLLLALPVLPGPGVVAELAPGHGDAAAVLVHLRAPLAGRELALGVQAEQLVAAEAVAAGGANLKVKDLLVQTLLLQVEVSCLKLLG